MEQQFVKSVFMQQAGNRFLLIIDSGRKEILANVPNIYHRQIGSSRLSFAKAEYMEKYLDITPGSVSIMGLMNDEEKKVQLLIDEDVMKCE